MSPDPRHFLVTHFWITRFLIFLQNAKFWQVSHEIIWIINIFVFVEQNVEHFHLLRFCFITKCGIIPAAITHLFNFFLEFPWFIILILIISSEEMTSTGMNSQISIWIKTWRTILTLKGKTENDKNASKF